MRSKVVFSVVVVIAEALRITFLETIVIENKTKIKHQTKQINNNKQDMAFRFSFYKVVSFALTTQGQVTSHPVIHFSRPENSVA